MNADERRLAWFCAAALFVLNVGLNYWAFLTGESVYRDSIEGGYASMARFFALHPSPFGWCSWQYEGLPASRWYLPFVPYLSALFLKVIRGMGPLEVYRSVVAVFLCFVPVSLFLLIRYFVGSVKWAFWTGVAFTFISPAYAVFPAIDKDRGITYLPWHAQVFYKYGEGPHNAGLAILPLALVACWRAGVSRSARSIVVAAMLSAAVALTNWIAALSLGLCVLLMLLSAAGTAPVTGFLGRRVLWAGGLAWLLAAFWLTPSFIQTTFFNWPADSFNYKLQVLQYVLLGLWVALPLAIRAAFWRRPKQYYLCFVAMAFAVFAFVAAVHYWWGVDVLPEARRYTIEAELFFFALVFEAARQLMAASRLRRDIGVAMLASLSALGSLQAAVYVTGGWKLRPGLNQTTPEYSVASFLAQTGTKGRVMVSGGTRFRLNSWFSLPQLGGTFESGLKNRSSLWYLYEVMTGLGSNSENRMRNALWQLRASGVEYLAVHGLKSKEHWRDIKDPDLFAKTFQAVYETGTDTVYRIPFRSLAHLVKAEELPPYPPIGPGIPYLARYMSSLDDTSRPTPDYVEQGTSAFEVRTAVPQGYWLKVAVAYDAGWEATQDGRRLAVEQDMLGHLLVKPAESRGSVIRFRYGPGWEQIALSGVSALTLIGCAVVLIRRRGEA